ncbi:MAG TPA: response regulator transcription factor [Thermoanaerobaculia bacterium]|nr:response regulator transcription factor [Thermoanaerobaculia bacterium]
MRILVVEDEAVLADALAEGLRDESYAVDVAGRGTEADELMEVNDYDLVILDWTIPAPSGIELLRKWRGDGDDTPVLMLTGRAGVADRVGGLDTGADDYLTKPFAFDELLARARSLLRRRARPLVPALSAGDLEMDRSAHRVRVAGESVDLAPKEFAVLEYLLTHKGQVVSKTALSEHVWDDSFDAMSNVVDVTVYRLRRKIDGDRQEKLLQTLKGVGYMLRDERA